MQAVGLFVKETENSKFENRASANLGAAVIVYKLFITIKTSNFYFGMQAVGFRS